MNWKFYYNYLEAKTKSLDGNIGAWLYTAGIFTAVYPVTSMKEAGDTLQRFADYVGILDRLRTDLALELTVKNTEFQAQARKLNVNITHSEVEQSYQNHAAERDIGELKKRYQQKILRKKVPKRVWEYGFVHQAEVLSRISIGTTGSTGIE